jgi:hypothetical protein
LVLLVFIFRRLTSQCEKCGEELYPGLQETSSNSCKCKKQQSKGLLRPFVKDLLAKHSASVPMIIE